MLVEGANEVPERVGPNDGSDHIRFDSSLAEELIETKLITVSCPLNHQVADQDFDASGTRLRICLVQQLELPNRLIGKPQVVVVTKSQKRCRGHFSASVPAAREASSSVVRNDPHWTKRVVALYGAIRLGAIMDDDRFDRSRIALRSDRSHGLAQHRWSIVGRDDDAEVGCH